MRLPHLDQRIELHHGEAAQLAHAIECVLRQELERAEPARVAAQLALCFGPLTRVGSRLLARARQECYHAGPPPKKPRQLVLRYDELAALMHILPTAPAAGQAWGQIQHASLNLERYIQF